MNDQYSLFIPHTGAQAQLVSLFDGRTVPVRAVTEQETRLIPEGKIAVDFPGCSLVLCPVSITVGEVKHGHEYYHYAAGAQVYAGVFTSITEGGNDL